MKFKWKNCPLSELYDFSSGLSKNTEEFGFGFPFLSFKTVFYHYFIPDTLYELVNTNEKEQSRCSIKAGDIFLTKTNATVDELGMSCVALKDYPKATFNGFTKRLRPKTPNVVYPKYAAYFFRSALFRQQINKMVVMKTRVNLNNDMLARMKISLPPKREQEIIGDTLYAIDTKITTNTMINHHLEQIAQALFKRFFIEESIDEPWGVLLDIAEINPFRPLQKGKEAVYVKMANLPTRGSFPTSWVVRPFSGGMKFMNGDTIMARISPCLENGKTAFINFLGEGEIAFGSAEYIVISPKATYCNEMFYYLARYQDFVSYAVKNMNGSSGRQRVSSESIGAYELHIPSSETVDEFEKVADPIMKIIAHNAFENRNLAIIRDTLLPRLMSGELSIADLGDVK